MPERGAATQGFSLDPAYPRAMLTDLYPPFLDTAPWIDPTSRPASSWRRGGIPDDNMAGIAGTAGRRRGRMSVRTSRARTSRS